MKRTPAAQARRNRQRGSSGERELCHILSEFLGQVVQRHLGQARDGGGDATVGQFVFECKRRKRIAGVYDWAEQATLAAEKVGKIPVVAFRADGKQWLVTFRLHDALALIRTSL